MTQHTIAIAQVRQILAGAVARGYDTVALLRRAGIPPRLLDAPLARVTQQQFAALVLTLRRTLRDELWGLCSRPLPIGSFDQGMRIAVACASLGDALERSLRHYRLLLADFKPALRVGAEEAALTLVARTPPGPGLAYAQRSFAFLAHGVASWLVARRVPLLAVDYPGPAPGNEAANVFQAPLLHGSAHHGWRFERRWLDLPVVQTEQSRVEFMRQAPTSLLVRYRDPLSTAERIRRIVRRHLDDPGLSLDAVGRALSMTPQTLRRRLAQEGQGFRTIKDDLRRDAAIECLARPELSLPEIAARLGFSEASTFNRAFKQWTGMAPGAYRQSARRGDGEPGP